MRVGTIVTAALLLACADQALEPEGDVQCRTPGELRCELSRLSECTVDGRWQFVEDCAARTATNCDGEEHPLLCTANLGCRACPENREFCGGDQLSVFRCNGEGTGFVCDAPVRVCDADAKEVCVPGEAAVQCRSACAVAAEQRSYVGCDYYAVDLDNANVGESLNAAAQQFAVVVSNPSPSLTAEVTIERNDAPLGEDPIVAQVGETIAVGREELEVIELPPREVDGSREGEFNTGTGTALTSQAYHLRSTAPIIAYQFNPLENFGVFSNDASLLVPATALSAAGTTTESAYLVLGWPQTIAVTDDPETNFGQHLRASLAIVGTEPTTNVEVRLSTDTIGTAEECDGKTPGCVPPHVEGDLVSVVLGPFDVLNLETGAFNADFSGTEVQADQPVVVFAGSEASDVPTFPGLARRQCCADHLEEQLFPRHTLGTRFVAVRSPSRTCALDEAGADVRCDDGEHDLFRFVATGEFPTVRTSLPAPNHRFSLEPGRPKDIEGDQDFVIEASNAISVGQFVTSQWVVCGPGNNDLPCGDPAFMIMPPVEQYRRGYLFLVPDKYAFDYLLIAARGEAREVRLDGQIIEDFAFCDGPKPIGTLEVQGEDVDWVSYVCALSEPSVLSRPGKPAEVMPGFQRDGVHRLTSDQPLGLVVYGFDGFVSYGYPGGTDLQPINVQ